MNGEQGYIELINKVLNEGNEKEDRTGTGVISIFGEMIKFELSDNNFPLLTTKFVSFKNVFNELKLFIMGQTDSKILEEKKCNIWKGNTSVEFIKKRGLSYDEGDTGPIYGFQWRHFGAKYISKNESYEGEGVDQLADVIDKIKNNPADRRMLVIAWNPVDNDKMVLPPCHVLFQFYVNNDILSLCFYQRSCDVGLGVPYNIASYSLLLIMVAHVCNLKPGKLTYFLADTHIYLNHVEALKEQVRREIYDSPKIFINKKVKNIEDFEIDDFILSNYKYQKSIRMKMAV